MYDPKGGATGRSPTGGASDRNFFRLAAAAAALRDLLAEQCAASGAEDRAERAVMPAVDLAPEQRADRATDDQAGRAVLLLAVVAAVAALPHLGVARDRLTIGVAVGIARIVAVPAVLAAAMLAPGVGLRGRRAVTE